MAAQRILIIKPSSLGDIVHALPVLAAVRAARPDAHVAWLAASGLAPLLEGHPLLDEVIPFDRARYGRMWRSPSANVAFWRFVRQIRRRRFDLTLDLQGLIRSGLLSFFSGARRRVGFAGAREGAWLFYSTRVRAPAAARHAVDRNLALARACGFEADEPRFPLGITQDERDSARGLLRTAAGQDVNEFIALAPGARWESKRWPSEHFAALLARLRSTGATVVLLGAPQDRALADEILAGARVVGARQAAPSGAALPGAAPPPQEQRGLIDLVGRTNLRQLAALISLARCLVCPDSGPMHLAAALNVPIVALFGPTAPEKTGPYSPLARVATHAVPCAPCLRRVCPLGHHDCLRGLQVDTVLEAVTRACASPRRASAAPA